MDGWTQYVRTTAAATEYTIRSSRFEFSRRLLGISSQATINPTKETPSWNPCRIELINHKRENIIESRIIAHGGPHCLDVCTFASRTGMHSALPVQCSVTSPPEGVGYPCRALFILASCTGAASCWGPSIPYRT